MKLLSWNVQWFCGLDGVVDVGRVVRTARSMIDFDLLCLQEVAVNYPALHGGGAGDQVAQLRQALPGYEICFGTAIDELADDGSGRRRFGNVIASRLPVLQIQHHALPYPAEAGVPSMPRLAVCATVRAPWGPLRVMTTHLEYYSQAMRNAQVRELRRLHAQAAALAARPPAPGESGSPFQARPQTIDCIVTGDFNCHADSPEYRSMLQAFDGAPSFVDAWALRHGSQPQPPTFRLHDGREGDRPVACDFVFVTDTLAERLRDVAVDTQTRASDHQPVGVTFAD